MDLNFILYNDSMLRTNNFILFPESIRYGLNYLILCHDSIRIGLKILFYFVMFWTE